MNSNRYYKADVEECFRKVSPLYHVLAYGRHGYIGCYDSWREWRSHVPENADSLQYLLTDQAVDDINKMWALALLLAPKLRELSDWWCDESDSPTYMTRETYLAFGGLSKELRDVLGYLLELNLKVVSGAQGCPPRSKYLEFAFQILRYELSIEVATTLLRTFSAEERARLLKDAEVDLTLRHYMIHVAREEYTVH